MQLRERPVFEEPINKCTSKNRVCERFDTEPCRKADARGFKCTRVNNHSGAHIACGGPFNHNLIIWD
jgi:hypothetical protein